jgi:prevent-host-death family protein
MHVGVGQLRDNLSRYLARVKEGDEIVVTEHGRAIAYISRKPRHPKLEALIAAGHATPPRSPKRDDHPSDVEWLGSDEDLDRIVADQKR